MIEALRRLTDLPVLSVRQPWASYLVSGMKSLELRSWSSNFAGWLWVHTGKKPDEEAMGLLNLRSEEFEYGGLVGMAKLVKIELIDSESKWFSLKGDHLSPGQYQDHCYGWRFENSFSLPELFACPGELGLFRLSEATKELVIRQFLREECKDFVRMASIMVFST